MSSDDEHNEEEVKCEVVKSVIVDVPLCALQGATHLSAKFKAPGIFGSRALYTRRASLLEYQQQQSTVAQSDAATAAAASTSNNNSNNSMMVSIDLGAVLTGFPMSKKGLHKKKWEAQLVFFPPAGKYKTEKGEPLDKCKVPFPELNFGTQENISAAATTAPAPAKTGSSSAAADASPAGRTVTIQNSLASLPWLSKRSSSSSSTQQQNLMSTITVKTEIVEKEEAELETAHFATLCTTRIKWALSGPNGDGSIFCKIDPALPVHVKIKIGLDKKEFPVPFAPTCTADAEKAVYELDASLPFVWELNKEEPRAEHDGECFIELREKADDKYPFKVYSYQLAEYAKEMATAWPVRASSAGTFRDPQHRVFSLPALSDDKIKIQSKYTKLFPNELQIQLTLSSLTMVRKVRMKVKSLLERISDVGNDMAAEMGKKKQQQQKKKKGGKKAGGEDDDGDGESGAGGGGDDHEEEGESPAAALQQLRKNLEEYEASLQDENSEQSALAKHADEAAGTLRAAGDALRDLPAKLSPDQIAGKLKCVEDCVRAFKASIKNPFVDPAQAFQVVMEDILPAAQAADIANKMSGAFKGLKKFHSALVAAGSAIGSAVDMLAPVASAALSVMGNVLGELGGAVAGVVADVAQAVPFIGMFIAPLISIAKKVYAQYNLMKEADEERETLLSRLGEHFEWFKRYQDFTKLLEKRGAQVRKLLAQAQLLIADCFDAIEEDKATGAGMRFVSASGRKDHFVSLRAELDSTFALIEKEIQFGFMFETLESVKDTNNKIDAMMEQAKKEANQLKRMIKELGSAVQAGQQDGNDLRRRAREIPEAYKEQLVAQQRAKLTKCDRSVHPEMMNEVQNETGRMLRFPMDQLFVPITCRRVMEVELVDDEEDASGALVSPTGPQQQQQRSPSTPASPLTMQQQKLRDFDAELMEGIDDLRVTLGGNSNSAPLAPMLIGGMLITVLGMRLFEQTSTIYPSVEYGGAASFFSSASPEPVDGHGDSSALKRRNNIIINNNNNNNNNARDQSSSSAAASVAARKLLFGNNHNNSDNAEDDVSAAAKQTQQLVHGSGGELQDLDVDLFSERLAKIPPASRVVVLEASSGMGKSSFAKMLCLRQKFPGFVAVYLSLAKLVNSSSSAGNSASTPPNASAFWKLLRRATTASAMSDLFVTIVEERNVPVVWLVDDLELVQTNQEAKNFLYDFVDPVNRARALAEQAEMMRQLVDEAGNPQKKKKQQQSGAAEEEAEEEDEQEGDATSPKPADSDPAKTDLRSSRGAIVRPEDLVVAVMRNVHISAGESCDFLDPAAPAQRWTLSPWDPAALRRLPYHFFEACKLRDSKRIGTTLEETLTACPAFTKSPFFAQLLCELTVRGGPTAEMIKKGTLRANTTQLLQLVVKESWDRTATLNKIMDRYSAEVRSNEKFDLMVKGAGSHALKYMRGHETLEFPVSVAPDNWAWLLTQSDLTQPAGFLQRVFIDMAYVEYFAAEFILRRMDAIKTIPWQESQRVVWLHLATLLAEDTDRFDERDRLVEAIGHNVAVKYAALSADKIAVRFRQGQWADLRRELALNLLCEVAEILDAGYNKIPHPARALMGSGGGGGGSAGGGGAGGGSSTSVDSTPVQDSTPLTGNAKHLKPGQMLSYTFDAVLNEFRKQRESESLLGNVPLPTLSKVSEWIGKKMPSIESMGKVGEIVREAKEAGRRTRAMAAAHANKLSNPWMMWCLEPCARAGCTSGIAWLEEHVDMPDAAWAEALYASFESRPELIASLLKKGARVDLMHAVKLNARRAVRRIIRANRLDPGASGVTVVSGKQDQQQQQQQQQQQYPVVAPAPAPAPAVAAGKGNRPPPLNAAQVARSAAASASTAAVASPLHAAIAESFKPEVEELLRVSRREFCDDLKSALRYSAKTRQAEISLELLGGAPLSRAGRAAIGAAMRCVRDGPEKISTQLTHLDLRDCDLRTSGAMEIFEAPLPALTVLSLARNAVGPRAFEYFARVARRNLPRLEQLNISSNLGCLIGVLLVVQAISEMPSMRRFDVSRNSPEENMRSRYSSDALKQLLALPSGGDGKLDAKMIAPQIVQAALDSPGIDGATYSEPYTYDVVMRITEWMMMTTSSESQTLGNSSRRQPQHARTTPLTRLSLSGSRVGVGGMRYLVLHRAHALQVAQLIELDLSDCNMDGAALQMLFNGLSSLSVPSWEALALAANPIGSSEGGVMALAELLKFLRDSPLRSLNLRDCGLGGGSASFLDLRGALRVQKHLRSIDLSNNALSSTGVFSIVADIPHIKMVNLSKNGLEIVETADVGISIERMSELMNLDLSFNPIDDTTIRQLRRRLKREGAVLFFQ